MILLVPVSLETAKQAVRDWHSHHDPMLGHMWSTGAVVDWSDLVGVVVVSRPVAPALQNANKGTWGGYTALEVTRLACKGVKGDPRTKHVASKLLAAACQSAEARGVYWMISYTRVDEDGVCYRAAGWVKRKEITPGRDHNTGNRRLRYLPGGVTAHSMAGELAEKRSELKRLRGLRQQFLSGEWKPHQTETKSRRKREPTRQPERPEKKPHWRVEFEQAIKAIREARK